MKDERNKRPVQITLDEKTSDSNAFATGARTQLKSVGASGTELTGGYFSEEYLQALRGKKGAKVYDEIRRSEPQVVMLLSAVMNPIKAAVFNFETANDVEGGEQHKELIEFILKDMIDWETFIHEALTFLTFGYSVFEVVNNVVTDHPKFGTFNGIQHLAFRSQKTIDTWITEPGTGELIKVQQIVTGDLVPEGGNTIQMDANFLLTFTLQKEGDNYEGISALRACYGPWFRKNLYLKLTGIGVEKSAIGTPLGKAPSGKEKSADFEAFKETLSNFTGHEQAYLIVPQGWDVSIIQSTFDSSKIKELVVQENTEMINAFVANFLALGTSGGGGSFALGTDLSDFFLNGIQNFANIIAGVLNRKLIPDLVKLNFGPQEGYPTLKITGINDKAGVELSTIITNLKNAGALEVDEDFKTFVRKQYSFPKMADKEVTDASVDPVTGEAMAADPNAVDVQKLSLNGSQVASLLSIVQRVALGLLPRDAGLSAIQTAFNFTSEQADAIMSSVGKGFAIDPTSASNAATLGVTLAERKTQRLQLAETYKKQWAIDKAKVKDVMQTNLKAIVDNYEKQIRSAWKSSNANTRRNLALQLEPKGLMDYTKELREVLAQIANDALIGATKETPKANKKKIKLSEAIRLAAPKGGYYDALPTNIKNIVKNQAGLIVQTQSQDINKIVSFQFLSSADSTEDVDQVIADIDDAILPTIDGSTGSGISLDAAAGNAVSSSINQARLEWFFEPEVLDTIESFTFTNEDPISEICQELDGTTWAAGDPDIDRFTPPLHHNCKSRLEVNEVGADNNPDINRGGTAVSQKALDSITLHECSHHYGLGFTLKK